MENLILTSMVGRRALELNLYSDMLKSLSTEIDLQSLFKPGLIYEARVMDQNGRSCTLKIDDWIFYAEKKVEDKLPEYISLKFTSGDDDTLSFQLVMKEKPSPRAAQAGQAGQAARESQAPQAGRSTEMVPREIASKVNESLKSFFPAISEAELGALVKMLPHMKGDIFQNVTAFNYLYKLNPERVKEHVASGKSDKIDIAEFQKVIMDTARGFAALQKDLPGGELRETLTKLVNLLEKMNGKIDNALQMKTLVDHESEPLAEGLKILQGDLTLSPARGHSEDQAPVAGRKIMAINDFLARDLNPDRIIDRVFKDVDNRWQTIFGWASPEQTSFLKGLAIDQRATSKEGRKSSEFHVSLHFDFKNLGEVKVVLFWMNDLLSCRITCYEEVGHMLFTRHRDLLKKKLESNNIFMQSLKVDAGGT